MHHLNDERKTPGILVRPILDYIPTGSKIWCPFDDNESKFVQILSQDNEVTYGHINQGKDFFLQNVPEGCQYIISNPPFSKKIEVFDRLFDIGLPFAMLMNLECLNYQVVGEFFKKSKKQLQLLIFDKKVSFDGNTSSFNTSYFCYKMLPKDLMFYHLEHNNTKSKFTME